MTRILIIVALAVLAAGAIIVPTVLLRHQAPDPSSPAVAADNPDRDLSPEPAPPDDLSALPPAAASDVAPPPETAVAAEPDKEGGKIIDDGSPSSAASAQDTKALLEPLLLNLTPKQRAALIKAAAERESARWTEAAKYALPSDEYLISAGMNLTPDQQSRIKAVKDTLKLRMDRALGEVWVQAEELNKRQQSLWENIPADGWSNPTFQAQWAQISKQYSDIRKVRDLVTAPLDQEYQAQVRPILTTDQQAALDNGPAEQKRLFEQIIQQWNARNNSSRK